MSQCLKLDIYKARVHLYYTVYLLQSQILEIHDLLTDFRTQHWAGGKAWELTIEAIRTSSAAVIRPSLTARSREGTVVGISRPREELFDWLTNNGGWRARPWRIVLRHTDSIGWKHGSICWHMRRRWSTIDVAIDNSVASRIFLLGKPWQTNLADWRLCSCVKYATNPTAFATKVATTIL